MSFGLHALLMSCLALASLPAFFFAPGYCLLALAETMGAPRIGRLERLLWAVVLSLPLSLLLSVHSGLPVSPILTDGLFVALTAAAGILILRDLARHPVAMHWDGHAVLATGVALGMAPYVVLSTVPISLHRALYESNVWQDWDVRTQLVNSAIRGGNAPANPMFAIAGTPAPLHYYFYWYVLCARMHDLVPGTDARAVLTASCVGAGLALLAFLLLAVKYLSPSTLPLRRQCSLALLAATILGLDLLGVALNLLHHRFFSDIQFWLDERSPGYLHMILWSPHHVAGLVCCGTAFILFVQSAKQALRARLLLGLLAGMCFAASFGASSFITLLFTFVCAGLAVDALLRREWSTLQTLATATVVAGLLVAPFAHALLRAPVSLPSPVAQGHLIILHARYDEQAKHLLWLTLQFFDKTLKHRPAPGDPNFNRVKWLLRLRPVYMLGLLVLDLGFFLFVLLAQLRHDLPRRHTLGRRDRVLWILFFGLVLPGSLLSSGSLQGNNDLGRHAGFCLRLVLILWSIPMLAHFFAQWRSQPRPHRWRAFSLATQCAVCCAAIGILSQIAQIVIVRLRVPMTDAGLLARVVVEERIPHVGFRFAQVQQAMAVADRLTPPMDIVQGNPHSRLRNVLLLYTNRQMAAADDGCNVPFGGDLHQCMLMSQQLVALFGGTGVHYHGEQRIFTARLPKLAAAMTPESFNQACSAFHLSTVVATYADPAWWDRQSWIWQLSPAYSNSTARVFRCPATSSALLAAARPGSESLPYTNF